jgi:trimeric autotransporter adhesin
MSFRKYLCLFTFLVLAMNAYADMLFEIKDELGNPVLVVSSDGLRILSGADTLMVISTQGIKAFIENDPAKGLSRTFAVTTTASKGSAADVMNVTTDGMRIYDQSGEMKALGDTLMTISSRSIKAHIKGNGKALSRTFAVTTTSSKGNETSLLNIGTDSTKIGTGATTMGQHDSKYTDFSPDNIFLGLNSGKSITDGKYNLFLGNYSGYSTRGDLNPQDPEYGYYNIFIGHESGYKNIGGKQNLFLGYKSGYENESGLRNVFIGDLSGTKSTGSQNTFTGSSSGANTTTGSGNSFFGASSGENNYQGDWNTFIGSNAGTSNNTGNHNTYLGSQAGGLKSGGNYNTLIGSNAGSSVFINTSNNVFLGYNAGYGNMGDGNVFLGTNSGSYYTNVNNSNRLFISNSNTMTPLIYGHFPNNHIALNADSVKVRALVSGSGNAVYRNATTGLLVASSSDVRLKENISPLKGGLEKVSNLQGVNFSWKSDDKHQNKIGFIAQEVEKIIPEVVFTNEADGFKGINYAEITAVLVEAVKELKAQFTHSFSAFSSQSEKIDQLIKENKELKRKVSELEELRAEIEQIKSLISNYAAK